MKRINAKLNPYLGWNTEIERLQDMLRFFEPRAYRIKAKVRELDLGNDIKLQFTVHKFSVGGVYESGFPSFIGELITPIPEIDMYPKIYTYYKNTYSSVFRAAKANGWRE